MSRVLLVDDSATGRESARSHLSIVGGHDVVVAEDSRIAQKKMLSAKFDVLVFDYFICPIDGYELLAWTRANKITTPVILLSAIDEYELRDMEKKAIAEGFSPVVAISKTAAPSLVLEAIAALTPLGHQK